jgi:predicted metal-dependent HD superfamily phosphohydrolase
VNRLDISGAVGWALDLLRTGLSPDLTYHNLWHTEHDVLPAAERLGRQSNLAPAELSLLRVGAAFHDLGFVQVYEGHEEVSARIAAEILPGYGFSAGDVERIQGMIMATRLPQSPRDQLEALMADADLDVLGRDDFFARNQALRQELLLRGEQVSNSEWLQRQLNFLQEHTYFTAAARKLRQPTKLTNIARVREMLQKA